MIHQNRMLKPENIVHFSSVKLPFGTVFAERERERERERALPAVHKYKK